MAKPKDISGQKFGRLTALKYLGKSKWLCKCDCGGTSNSRYDRLVGGHAQSCGCNRKLSTTKHGMSRTHTYRIWQGIKARCNNPNDTGYSNYGGRGIKVCDEWLSFDQFLIDMGTRPKDFEIDRINNDGDYEPSNCRWVTKSTNMSNTRRSNRVTWNGVTMSIAEWAKHLNVPEGRLRNRLQSGWSVEKAFESQSFNRDQVLLEHNGEKLNVTEWSKRTGINRETLYARIYKGWDVGKILTTPARKKSDVKS